MHLHLWSLQWTIIWCVCCRQTKVGGQQYYSECVRTLWAFYLGYIRLFHEYASACGSFNIAPCDIHWVYIYPIPHPTAAASSTDLLILSKICTLYSSFFLYQGNSLTSDKIRSIFSTMASAAASVALYQECRKCQKRLQFNMTLCQVQQLAARVLRD